MPLRDNAIVLCSCGKRWGNVALARICEEALAAEVAIVAGHVPMMVLHWAKLGHALRLRPGAAVEFVDIIVRVANQVAEEAAAEPGGSLRTAQSTRSLRPPE